MKVDDLITRSAVLFTLAKYTYLSSTLMSRVWSPVVSM